MKRLLLWWNTSDKFISIPLILSVLSAFLITTTFAAAYNFLPNRLPLFYSLPWGEKELIYKHQFFVLPAVLLLITFINSAFTWQLHPSQIILKRVMFLILVFVNLFILVTAFKILYIFI